MYTDASGTGFGVDCGGRGTNGLWNEEERECHINYQELLAIKLGLQTNFDNKFNEHIQCSPIVYLQLNTVLLININMQIQPLKIKIG